MSVPTRSVVCQLAIAASLLVLAGVLWLSLPRYQLVGDYRMDVRSGEILPCFPQQSGDIRCG